MFEGGRISGDSADGIVRVWGVVDVRKDSTERVDRKSGQRAWLARTTNNEPCLGAMTAFGLRGTRAKKDGAAPSCADFRKKCVVWQAPLIS